jgi:aerobic C4-dicarboxylate transport protein
MSAMSKGAPRLPLYRVLYVQVIVALVAGVAIGHLWPAAGVALRPLADGFVKLVRMMIAPVVFCTIVVGITSMPDTKEIGRTLLKAVALFYALVTVALLTGLVAAFVLRPGAGMNIDPLKLDASSVAQYARQAPVGFVAFLLHIIPQSYVGAFADGEVLPVLFIAILTGWALTRIGPVGDPVRQVIQAFLHVSFAVFSVIVKLSAIGALGAMAFTVGQYGIASLLSLAWLVVTFFAACIAFVALVLGAIARAHGFSVWKLIRYFKEELLIIFGTSTSDPVLPQLLLKLEKLGCQKAIVGLVLPMSYSFNLTGIAIFLTVASIFIAQACNVHLSAGQVATMVAVMLLTSKGATGVAGSGFVVLVATLSVVPSIPIAGVALIVGVDRFMSEVRAITSTIGNAVATIVVAKWEHACDHAILTRELERGYLAAPSQLLEGQIDGMPSAGTTSEMSGG